MTAALPSGSSRIRTSEPRLGMDRCRDEILAAVSRVLDQGQYILGPEVEAFEREFAAFVGTGDAVGVGTGTAAIELALKALEVGNGDAVFTVSHTSGATIAAIELAGARPVFVDIDRSTFVMDPRSLESAIAAVDSGIHGALRPAAVIPVHLYGHPAPMPEILRIARQHKLRIVEDASQSHGARIGEIQTGTFGEAGAFSLYPTKNLGALGDGGILACGHPGLADRVRRLRQYGWRQPQCSEEPGTNSRLDELQAAILRIRLRRLEEENVQRRQLAARFNRDLADRLACPRTADGCVHAFHLYVVRTAARDRLRSHLAESGIDAGVHYPLPVHLQPAYLNRLPMAPGGLPVTESVSGQILSLPLHPHLTEEEADRIVSAVNSFPGNLLPD